MGDRSASERSVKLMHFLKEYVQLRESVVQDVASYGRDGSVLWFHNLPQGKGCVSPFWVKGVREGIWLEIEKPVLTAPPRPKLGLEPWVVLPRDSSSEPQLRDEIRLPNHRAVNDENVDPEIVVRIEDHPDKLDLWDAYIVEWRRWRRENKAKLELLDAYNDFYQAYQGFRERRESMEVILGLGLAVQALEGGKSLRRHVITAAAEIRFDQSRGVITVQCPGPPDGADPTFEDEFFANKTNPDDRSDIEDLLDEVDDAVVEVDVIMPALTAIGNTLDGKSQVAFDLTPPTPELGRLKINLAPALIVRHRTQRGIVRAYEQLADEMSQKEMVPSGLMSLVTPDSIIRNEVTSAQGDDHSFQSVHDPQDLLFPLPTNDEQMKIAESLSGTPGVLVQGPPGTGKSHTIANLMCHLLGQGRRVLVTSETATALSVLKQMLPSPLQDLCVSLLGDSRDAFQELSSSVNGINQRYATFDTQKYDRRIDDLTSALSEAKSRRAKLDKDIISLRTSETEHVAINELYTGTPSRVGQLVNENAPTFSWYRAASHPELSTSPLSNDEATTLLHGLRKYLPEARYELGKSLPPPDSLFSHSEMETLIEQEARFRQLSLHHKQEGNAKIVEALKLQSDGYLEELEKALRHARSALKSLEERKLDWALDAVNDAFSRRTEKWQALMGATKPLVSNTQAQESAALADEVEITLPEGKTRSRVLADAKAMLDHLASGGRWSLLGIPVGESRGRTYLKKSVAVGGKPPVDLGTLERLVRILEIKGQIERAWDTWASFTKPRSGQSRMRLAELREHHEGLVSLDHIVSALEAVGQVLEKASPSIPHEWTKDGLQELEASTLAAITDVATTKYEQPLEDLAERLRPSEASHPVCELLRSALEARDANAWREALEALASVRAQRDELAEIQQLMDRLQSLAPSTAQKLNATKFDNVWDNRLNDIEAAHFWSEAKSWIKRHNDPEAVQRLERDYSRLGDRIGELTAELAAERAWRKFLSRLTTRQEQSLQAWRQAIQRIGKGTGKYASRYRKVAREHMDVCIPAIPAWVLPRTRLPEILPMRQKLFDVVIVDEASQTGIDGLFLACIAERIIIVGDDKQTSPTVVVSHEEVLNLQSKYLSELHVGSAIDERTSLYDLAGILFRSDAKIVLREHFRCMPEIIRFSDLLCYAPEGTPLIPLRNFAPDRLEPLKSTYIEDGYTKGRSSSSLNEPEARALVETIAKCISDPAYEKKSFGVISLVGSQQAKYVNKLLLDRIGAEEMARRDLRCGDAYSFQGSERDVMFLSLVSAPSDGQRVRALTDQTAQQRFNVAVSRAKDQAWLFHSARLEHLSDRPDCVRRQLVQFFTQKNELELAHHDISTSDLLQLSRETVRGSEVPTPFDSWFEVDVFLALHSRGYKVRPQFPVAEFRIDLVVEGAQGRLAIECDGDRWHGIEEFARDMQRQRKLERAGWQFWRVRGSDFYTDRNKALEPLWHELERRGIRPSLSEDSEPMPGQYSDYIEQAVEEHDVPQKNLYVQRERAAATGSDSSDDACIGKYLEWARGNPTIPVTHRLVLAEIEGKLEDGHQLNDSDQEAIEELRLKAGESGYQPC